MWPITGMSTCVESRDGLGHVNAALELHALGAAFLDHAAGIGDGVCDRDLVGEKRHVADEQSALAAARDHARVVDHLVHGDAEGVVVALHHHAERVTDQQQIRAGTIGDAREREVVRGQHRELALAFGGEHARNSHLGFFETSRHENTSRTSAEGSRLVCNARQARMAPRGRPALNFPSRSLQLGVLGRIACR